PDRYRIFCRKSSGEIEDRLNQSLKRPPFALRKQIHHPALSRYMTSRWPLDVERKSLSHLLFFCHRRLACSCTLATYSQMLEPLCLGWDHVENCDFYSGRTGWPLLPSQKPFACALRPRGTSRRISGAAGSPRYPE